MQEWRIIDCHQNPNPPSETQLIVKVDEGCQMRDIFWKPYKIPLKNLKRAGRFVDKAGDCLKENRQIRAWRLQ